MLDELLDELELVILFVELLEVVFEEVVELEKLLSLDEIFPLLEITSQHEDKTNIDNKIKRFFFIKIPQ